MDPPLPFPFAPTLPPAPFAHSAPPRAPQPALGPARTRRPRPLALPPRPQPVSASLLPPSFPFAFPDIPDRATNPVFPHPSAIVSPSFDPPRPLSARTTRPHTQLLPVALVHIGLGPSGGTYIYLRLISLLVGRRGDPPGCRWEDGVSAACLTVRARHRGRPRVSSHLSPFRTRLLPPPTFSPLSPLPGHLLPVRLFLATRSADAAANFTQTSVLSAPRVRPPPRLPLPSPPRPSLAAFNYPSVGLSTRRLVKKCPPPVSSPRLPVLVPAGPTAASRAARPVSPHVHSCAPAPAAPAPHHRPPPSAPLLASPSPFPRPSSTGPPLCLSG